jgi:hypothetical protein
MNSNKFTDTGNSYEHDTSHWRSSTACGMWDVLDVFVYCNGNSDALMLKYRVLLASFHMPFS